MSAEQNRYALFDSDDGAAILLQDYRRTICFDGNGLLSRVFDALEVATAQGEWVALAVDYGLGAYFEPAAPMLAHDRPLLRGWVFGRARQLAADAVATFLEQQQALLSDEERVAGIAELIPSQDALSYAARVEQIRRWIADGDCYQINLTFPLDFKVYGDPLALYARLRQRQPVRYGAYISAPEETVLSFSPELFFERQNHRVVTRPMKGTAPRGIAPEEDEVQRTSLLASEKDRAENIMIVDLLRNDLGRLALPGQVRVESLCAAEAYPTLWQLVSTVSAQVPDVRLFDLFRALFPCGSITGAPKVRAMQRIADLEKNAPRGLYTGALGWLSPGGDCRFNVAIRTVELGAGGRAQLGVGSGIVIDSEPEKEYAECLLKARFLTGFDPGFELIETIRMEHGEYPLLSLHLERLETSAHALGFRCEVPAIRTALLAQLRGRVNEVNRVRLTLAHGGAYRLVVTPLSNEQKDWHVVWAEARLDAGEYLLRHKTSARSRYDQCLAKLASRPEVFDAIFLNARGEICEGARSTVFVERKGMLLTPPLSCGLLPGVLRRSLIESGRTVEHVLRREDVLGASRLYVGNALRGLIPVTLKK